MTTIIDPLLHAVLANPEYDIVRLVYADALEEAGDGERAEFIRVQITLANQRNPKRRPPASKENDRVQDRLEKRINVLWRGGINFIFQDEMCNLFEGSVATVVDPRWRPQGRSVFLVERGFVSSVRCSLAAWRGEECELCRGQGMNDYYSDIDGRGIMSLPCIKCRGTRRIPGHGAETVAKHPVTRVEFTDREPLEVFPETWCWSFGVSEPHRIPVEVFLLLRENAKGAERIDFPSRESALAALSAAAIRWARAEAVRRELVPDVWSKT